MEHAKAIMELETAGEISGIDGSHRRSVVHDPRAIGRMQLPVCHIKLRDQAIIMDGLGGQYDRPGTGGMQVQAD